jgi:hypothetical protein
VKIHWSKRLAYTTGVYALAEQHVAHWLIELVTSYQPYPHVTAEAFQVWRLAATGTSTVVTMADGNSDTAIVTLLACRRMMADFKRPA